MFPMWKEKKEKRIVQEVQLKRRKFYINDDANFQYKISVGYICITGY